MNILIIGNGGREHALAWKISQSPRAGTIFVAPGNAGTATVATNIPIETENFSALGEFCLSQTIELVVVGPEGPLVRGIRDYFEHHASLRNILMVGPAKSGARLEGSKDFSKKFMVRHGIPTAAAKTFSVDALQDALEYVRNGSFPVVLKADGLAAGKGVIIALNAKDAETALHEMLAEKKFGEASARVLVEEFLEGIELSVFVLTDGTDYVILPEAKDYKRIGDDDTGLNTGGMGAVSPVVFADELFMTKVEEQIIKPTIAGLHSENIPYRGFIFIGLIRVKGEPYVIEYNARMGDPETQAVLPRIKNDFLELLEATAKGNLKGLTIEKYADTTTAVVLVAGGYPGRFEKGDVITGIDHVQDALVFQAGTRETDGAVLTDGGRVLAVTGKGKTIQEASDRAYRAISGIRWNGVYFRKDIGVDLQRFKE